MKNYCLSLSTSNRNLKDGFIEIKIKPPAFFASIELFRFDSKKVQKDRSRKVLFSSLGKKMMPKSEITEMPFKNTIFAGR